MAILTCGVCGLLNYDTRSTCLRCESSLSRLEAGPWRDGQMLVVERDGELPARCVQCGIASGSSRLRQKYHWHHPALYLLALPALLLYVIVALSIRKSATLHLGLCQTHFARRRRAVIGGWLLASGGIGAAIAVAGGGPDFLAAVSLALILSGAVWIARRVSPLRAVHIDDSHVRLKGAAPRFLRELPAWGGFR